MTHFLAISALYLVKGEVKERGSIFYINSFTERKVFRGLS